MGKFFLILLALLCSLVPPPSFACVNGDKSKILLVIAESDDGEENKVVGEIHTNDGSVSITSASYFLLDQADNTIHLESTNGHKYAFDRRNHSARGGFCFEAIYPN